jgi:hypothetical protein
MAMQSMTATPLTVTLTTASFVSGLSRSTLLRRADDGSLATVLVGGRRLVVLSSLRKMLGLNEQQSAA